MSSFIQYVSGAMPIRYLLSRLRHRKEWADRKAMFRTRRGLSIQKWMEILENKFPEKEVVQALRTIENYLNIPKDKVSPADRCNIELALPDEKLHDRAISEIDDEFEGMIYQRRGYDFIFPKRQVNYYDCTVLELTEYLLRLLNPLNNH